MLKAKVHPFSWPALWEECEWMVKYKLECDTLECVCGAVFEAWVASGGGESEEWLESTSEGGLPLVKTYGRKRKNLHMLIG